MPSDRMPEKSQRASLWRAPAEGWLTVALHLALVVAAAQAVALASKAISGSMLLPLAAAAALLGMLLAKVRTPDMMAHLVAFLTGILLPLCAAAWWLDDIPGTWPQRVQSLVDLARYWFTTPEAGRPLDDPRLFLIALGVTTWLVGYASAWMLYRRAWALPAITLPLAVIVINIGYAPETSTRPLVAALLAAGLLVARHFAFRREQDWRAAGVPVPHRSRWALLRTGVLVVTVAVLAGWMVPNDATNPLVDQAAQRLEQPWQTVQEQWDNTLGKLTGQSRSGGDFSSFDSSFELGGSLNLSDEPVALVTADQSFYLPVQRYDVYNGRGWSTDIQDTFRTDSEGKEVRAPLITFEPQNGVFLSSNVTAARVPVSALVTVYRPKGELLLTIETYLSSSERASIQVGWRQLENEPFTVRDATLGSIPEDLRSFVLLLQQARYTIADTPLITDPSLGTEIVAAKSSLAGRYLDLRWTVGGDGQVEVLFVTGKLPVYDDVEAVIADEAPEAGTRYQVTGLQSQASAEELRLAGGDYPSTVIDRYLPLPNTITVRMLDLTGEVVAGIENPYDQAAAIEVFLRSNYTYREDIEAPPPDQDAVDYLLFDSREGYCEYYASAMVVMLRIQGIPARMVAGYRNVDYSEADGGYLYREKQAHTWVEAYFPAYGWIPFEPTPISNEFERGTEQPTPVPTPTPEPEIATPVVEPEATLPPSAPPTTPGTGTPSLLDRVLEDWPLVLGSIALLLVSFSLIRSQRPGRQLGPAGRFYARTLKIGGWFGIRPGPATTPREYAQSLGDAIPTARGPLSRLAWLYSVEQYAPSEDPAVMATEGNSAWKEVRSAAWHARLLRRRKRGGGKG